MVAETYAQRKYAKSYKQVAYDVVNIGDINCEHLIDRIDLVKQDGIAWAEFKCKKCERVISQCIGEILIPETWDV